MSQGIHAQLSRSPKNKTALQWRSRSKGSVPQGKTRTDASFSCCTAQGLQSSGLASAAQCHAPAPAPCRGHRAAQSRGPTAAPVLSPRSPPPPSPAPMLGLTAWLCFSSLLSALPLLQREEQSSLQSLSEGILLPRAHAEQGGLTIRGDQVLTLSLFISWISARRGAQ